MATSTQNPADAHNDARTSSLTAQDVMTANPRTCSTFSTVLEAVMIFRDADCGAVPVLENGKPVGVLTDRDVALALAEHPDLAGRRVSDIMSKDVISVPPDASLATVKDRFGDHLVRRLLVIDKDGQLQGIIAWADIAPRLSDQSVGQVVSEVVESR
jgi:CBS domain-containing protein